MILFGWINKMIKDNDIFDIALFDEVCVIKRCVFSRPALAHGDIPGDLHFISPEARGWTYHGPLDPDLSTEEAYEHIAEAYGK